MATAAQKCFGVFELLENILFLLPPTDLTRVTRVSSTWKQTIEQSKSLRENRAVSPLSTFSPPAGYGQFTRGIPLYAREADIKPNTNLQVRSKSELFYEGVEIKTCDRKRYTLREVSAQFATFPPCKVMHLWTNMVGTTCTIYIKDGIRIKDLFEVSASLLEGEGVSTGRTQSYKYTAARFFADEDNWDQSARRTLFETFPI